MSGEIQNVLDCIARLERAVGKVPRWGLVAVSRPFTATVEDRQRLVWQMSIAMGLPFDFRVRTAPLVPGIVAQVELYNNGGTVVDVTTCPGLEFYPWRYSSAVCHELAHLYLKCHRLDYTDELLTDVCALYLGFGGYMLNGKLAAEHQMDRDGASALVLPCQSTYGYLTVQQLMFAFRYLCQRRGIPPRIAYRGVCDSSLAYVDLEDPEAKRLTAGFQDAVQGDPVLKSQFSEAMRRTRCRMMASPPTQADLEMWYAEYAPEDFLTGGETPGFELERENGDDSGIILAILAAIGALIWWLCR